MGARSAGSTSTHHVTWRPARQGKRPTARRPLLCLLLSALVLASCARGSRESAPSPAARPATTAVAAVQGGPSPTLEGSPTLGPAATPTPLPAGPPDDTLLALGELMDDEGRLPVQVAMEIFAAYVAPLPGVAPRRLPGESTSSAAELATQVLLENRDQLPPEVARAVEEALFGGIEEEIEIPPSGSQSDRNGLFGTLARALSPPGVRAQDQLEQLSNLVEDVRQQIEARSGRRLRISILVGLNPHLQDNLQAIAHRVLSSEGSVAGCRIVFNTSIVGNSSLLEFVVAHEVWHCFQNDFAGVPEPRAWIREGQAEWVAAEVASDPSPATTNWNTWLGAPHVSLWNRSYDAIGLYAAAQAAGSDPFEAMIDMFRLENREAVSRLFGGRTYEEALWIVSTSLVRAPQFGPEWEANGRGITATRATSRLEVAAPTIEAADSRQAGAFGSLPKELAIAGGDREFVRIAPTGDAYIAVVEFPGHGPLDVPPGAGILFCLVAGQCTCPDGSGPEGGPPPPLLEDPHGVATVFTTDGGEIGLRLDLVDRDEVCERLVGTWVAPAEEIVRANLAPYGGLPADLSCTGQVVMTFGADGSFRRTHQGECRAPIEGGEPIVATTEGEATGTYEDLGDSFVLHNVQFTGRVAIEGFGTTLGDLSQDVPVPYTIEGDRLILRFTDPNGNTIVHVYTRAG